MAAIEDRSEDRIRVLIVDDHPLVREIVRLACEDRPDLLVVGVASHGHEALDRCRELCPDVVVLDLTLPGMDGLEVAANIRREGWSPRILVMTARDDGATVFEAIRAGVDGYLDKSVPVEAIAAAVVAVAAGTRVFSVEQERLAEAELNLFEARAREAMHAAAQLTPRERQVLALIVQGLSTRQVASRLGMSERTAETHIANLYRKLDARTRAQTVHRAATLGLVELRGPATIDRT